MSPTPRPHSPRLLLLLLALAGVAQASEPTAPDTLAETGLYADEALTQVHPRNLAYAPQYPLWTDGAVKRRWVYLPPGTSIDARRADAWRFPAGTKLWKEFSFGGRRVETRYLERLRNGTWRYATYAWSEDGTRATRVEEAGRASTVALAPDASHALPGVADCKNCHEGGKSVPLGFTALQLSPDRDPLAVHAEAPEGLTLPELEARGLLRGLPRALLQTPPRIAAETPEERAALGYLHANCGGCHDAEGPLANLELPLQRRAVGDLADPAEAVRARGDVLLARISTRTPSRQMPPLGTVLVDDAAVALVSRWLGQPAPEARR